MSSSYSHTDTGGQVLTPFQRKRLQKDLQDEKLSPRYRQRIQIMLLADEGKTQNQICELLKCSRVTARYWISQAKSGEAHNWQATPLGRPKAVNQEYKERLRQLVGQSPKDFGYSKDIWTADWLSKSLENELDIKVDKRHINRLLKEMGLSTRPKPIRVDDTTQDTNKRIVIRDLNSAPNADSVPMWPFNSISIG
ncbi:helix-turn-helix domain-containing protein [Nodularia sp. UHCC 0506]|uniref:helix-turn-helix domain-containing protein n=1 Tax=Nodularia sp. UHCC 0506 TaxID=3110243 RepID=UPI002B21EE63|nr:helix-turn-helix domain-containing protein [Nodularia sp. UHCC 0506]MEA5516742.1 helix-turn-helix domain-containing protein [Nodularia sp. UHCC 0506]